MKKMLRNKKGQGMSEYLIILALVAIATIGAVIFFADNVRDQIATITEELVGSDAADVSEAGDSAAAKATYGMDTYTDSAVGAGSQ
jgi:Flp pilus assembly pilin Flp